MTTPTLTQLKAELDQLTKRIADLDPTRITVEEWRTVRAKMKALASMVAKLENKGTKET